MHYRTLWRRAALRKNMILFNASQRIQTSGCDMLKLPGSIKVLCCHLFRYVSPHYWDLFDNCSIKYFRAPKHSSRYILALPPGVTCFRGATRSSTLCRKGVVSCGRIASDRSDDSHFVVSHSSENSRLWLTALQNYYPKLSRVTFTRAIKIHRLFIPFSFFGSSCKEQRAVSEKVS